jgi:hypothetical protein
MTKPTGLLLTVFTALTISDGYLLFTKNTTPLDIASWLTLLCFLLFVGSVTRDEKLKGSALAFKFPQYFKLFMAFWLVLIGAKFAILDWSSHAVSNVAFCGMMVGVVGLAFVGFKAKKEV